jgi:general secretion pathway protein L
LAWSELFYETGRFFNAAISEPVKLTHPDGQSVCISQEKVIPDCTTQALAFLLPAERCLVRELKIPAEAESALADYIGLEVTSSSPFPAEETRYGWKVVSRSNGMVHLVLIITSHMLISQTLAEQSSRLEKTAHEIWAKYEHGYIEIRGYAESMRYKRSQRRLAWLGVKVALLFGLLLAMSLLPTAFKRLEMQRVSQQYMEVEAKAAQAVALREQLVANNNLVADIQALPATRLDVLEQLERLTRNLPDDVHLISTEITPLTIRISGLADDAAALMQALNADPAYARVTAPAAISINRRTGKEQFTLEITLKPQGEA